MLLVIGAACLFAGGVWLVASAVWPAPRRLATALEQLNAPWRGRPMFVSAAGHEPSWSLSVGRWLVKRVKAGTLADAQTRSDLELVGRPLEVYAGSVALTTVFGALLGPALWAATAIVGTRLQLVVPVWAMLLGAVVGWFLPRVLLRADTLLQNFLLLLLLGNAPLKYHGFALQVADLTFERQMSNGWLSATGNEAAAYHIAVRRQEHELRELPSQLKGAFEAGRDECCGEVRERFFNGSCVVFRDTNHLFERNQRRLLPQRFSPSGLMPLVVAGWIAAKQEERGASGAAIP